MDAAMYATWFTLKIIAFAAAWVFWSVFVAYRADDWGLTTTAAVGAAPIVVFVWVMAFLSH